MSDPYLYTQSEPNLWTVGTGDPRSGIGGNWEPDSDHGTREEAAARVAYLNGGGGGPDLAAQLAAAQAECKRLRAALALAAPVMAAAMRRVRDHAAAFDIDCCCDLCVVYRTTYRAAQPEPAPAEEAQR